LIDGARKRAEALLAELEASKGRNGRADPDASGRLAVVGDWRVDADRETQRSSGKRTVFWQSGTDVQTPTYLVRKPIAKMIARLQGGLHLS